MQNETFIYNTTSKGEAEIMGYCGSQNEIEIPKKIDGYPVTSINKKAFSFHRELTDITIPEGVRRIDDGAFMGCDGLANIRLPESLTDIGRGAFFNCTNLKSVFLPGGVMNIGNSAFECCTNLERVNIPNSVTHINYSTFEDCTNLKSINIPDGVTHISINAFRRCTKLESVSIPDSVTDIGRGAFGSCANSKNITIYGYVGTAAEEYAKANGFNFCLKDKSEKDLQNPDKFYLEVTPDEAKFLKQKGVLFEGRILDKDKSVIRVNISDRERTEKLIASAKAALNMKL